MSKKITKQELEKIIAEEINNTFISEGVVSSMSNWLRNMYRNVGEPKEPNNTTTNTIQQKDAVEEPRYDAKTVLVLAGQFLSSFVNEIYQNKFFKETPIAKKFYGLQEGTFSFTDPQKAVAKELEDAVLKGTITINEIITSFQIMAKDPELKNYILSLSDDAEKVFGLDKTTAVDINRRSPEREKRLRTPKKTDVVPPEFGGNLLNAFELMMKTNNIAISRKNLDNILKFLAAKQLLYRAPSSMPASVSEAKKANPIIKQNPIIQDKFPDKRFDELVDLSYIKILTKEIAEYSKLEQALVKGVLVTIMKYGKLAYDPRIQIKFQPPIDNVTMPGQNRDEPNMVPTTSTSPPKSRRAPKHSRKTVPQPSKE